MDALNLLRAARERVATSFDTGGHYHPRGDVYFPLDAVPEKPNAWEAVAALLDANGMTIEAYADWADSPDRSREEILSSFDVGIRSLEAGA